MAAQQQNGTMPSSGYDSRLPDRPLARRSVSIFSRSGTEVPEPPPPFIVQASLQTAKRRRMTWPRKKTLEGSSAPKIPARSLPKGTVLKAVPAAPVIKMTGLEEEMATSPNEEIKAAINGTPWSAGPSLGLSQTETTSPKRRAKRTRRQAPDHRIGIWADGVIHWDKTSGKLDNDRSGQRQLGFTPVVPPPMPKAAGRPTTENQKPLLSVVIPQSDPLITTLPDQGKPGPRKQTQHPLSAPARSDQSISTALPHDVSPIQTAMKSRQSLGTSVDYESSRTNSQEFLSPLQRDRHTSSSSSSSLFERDDSSSLYSIGSSETSFGELSSNVCTREPKVSSIYSLPPEIGEPSICPPRRAAPARPTLRSVPERPFADSSNLAPTPTNVSAGVSLPRETPASVCVDRLGISLAPPGPGWGDDTNSPTLSEAVDDLEASLKNTHMDCCTGERSGSGEDGSCNALPPEALHRSSSIRAVMHPPERAPTIPKRSRRRDWVSQRDAPRPRRRRSLVPVQGDIPQTVRRTASVVVPHKTPFEYGIHSHPVPSHTVDCATTIPSSTEVSPEDMYRDLRLDEEATEEMVSAAESVLITILSSLSSVDDLFNAAMGNKGMYRVYKKNETQLVQSVLRNQSAAAFEFMEWSSADIATSGSVPRTYVQIYREARKTIQGLKHEILKQCHSVIRRETAFALTRKDHPSAQHLEDALWRISSFCQIFGCGKGREEDVAGQLDWLRGGVLAHNQDLTPTMTMNMEYELSSVLLNPPEHFAKGNGDGLDAQELYDMMEIWNCLISFLQGYHGRTEEAQEYGVFDGCDVPDDDSAHAMLEEWTAYLLTLGPSVISTMASCSLDTSEVGFATARANGWTRWTPPRDDESRTTFLKQPVSCLYEERVAAAARRLHDPQYQEMKDLSRQRVSKMAAEIRIRRRASSYKRLPVMDMSMEHPTSPVLSRTGSTTSTCTRNSSLSHTYSMRHAHPPRNLSTAQLNSPSSLWASRRIGPIVEERVETYDRMSLQNFVSNPEDTSARAVKLIVDMGFSAADAKESLRLTDMGDGLKVDRAVDLLLRRQCRGAC